MARPTLILHAGTYKTGTTALQWFLWKNRDRLRAAGLYRPATGAGDGPASWGHHALVQGLNRPGGAETWAALAAECAAAGTPRAVISSELFCNIRAAQALRPVVAAFAGWEIRTVVYFRRQDRYLESLYNHHVKAAGECDGIEAFAERIAHRLDYRGFVQVLERAFGPGSTTVRVYEPERMQGDICADFLATLGIAMPPGAEAPERALNPGLTRRGLTLMLRANRRYRDDPARLEAIRQKTIQRHAAPPHSDHAILTPPARRALMQRYRPGNGWIAARFLDGQKPMFSPRSRPAGAGQKQGQKRAQKPAQKQGQKPAQKQGQKPGQKPGQKRGGRSGPGQASGGAAGPSKPARPTPR